MSAMSKKYCLNIFSPGLTCRFRSGNRCYGFMPVCGYCSKEPPSVEHTIAEELFRDETFKREMEWIKSGKGLPPLNVRELYQ